MRLLWDNELDKKTLTFSSEADGYPGANIQDIRLIRAWRSTGDTSEWVKFDAGEGKTINPNYAAIAAHNLTAGATIKIQGNASDAWEDPTVDESFVYDPDIMVRAFTGQALRFWRFLFEDAANPEGYIETGRLYLGGSLQLPGIEPSYDIPPRTTSRRAVSRSGQSYGNRGYVYLAPGFTFPFLTDTERQNIDAMWREVENIDPVFLLIWENSLDVVGPLYVVIDQTGMPFKRTGDINFAWQLIINFREVF